MTRSHVGVTGSLTATLVSGTSPLLETAMVKVMSSPTWPTGVAVILVITGLGVIIATSAVSQSVWVPPKESRPVTSAVLVNEAITVVVQVRVRVSPAGRLGMVVLHAGTRGSVHDDVGHLDSRLVDDGDRELGRPVTATVWKSGVLEMASAGAETVTSADAESPWLSPMGSVAVTSCDVGEARNDIGLITGPRNHLTRRHRGDDPIAGRCAEIGDGDIGQDRLARIGDLDVERRHAAKGHVLGRLVTW